MNTVSLLSPHWFIFVIIEMWTLLYWGTFHVQHIDNVLMLRFSKTI